MDIWVIKHLRDFIPPIRQGVQFSNTAKPSSRIRQRTKLHINCLIRTARPRFQICAWTPVVLQLSVRCGDCGNALNVPVVPAESSKYLCSANRWLVCRCALCGLISCIDAAAPIFHFPEPSILESWETFDIQLPAGDMIAKELNYDFIVVGGTQ